MGFRIFSGAVMLAVCSALAGCLGEESMTDAQAPALSTPSTVPATGGSASTTPAPGTTTTSTPPSETGSANATASGQNAAPEFLYAPGTSAVVGARYGYRAAARDTDGDALTWSIANLPSWAYFDSATGDLVGTPGTQHVGAWNNIVITVSDGRLSRSMEAFSITVTQAAATGTAALSWAPPVENEDGSSLTNLAGYRIYGGSSANTMSLVRTITSPGITTAVIEGLGVGTAYFAISAFTSAGLESDRSSLGSKTIR